MIIQFKKGDIVTWKPGKKDHIGFWRDKGITTFKEHLLCGESRWPDDPTSDIVFITCPNGTVTDEHACLLVLVRRKIPTFVVYLNKERNKSNG